MSVILMSYINCMKCRIDAFKNALCEDEFCKKYHGEGTEDDFLRELTNPWILCSDRLPDKPEQVLIYAESIHYVLAKYKEIRRGVNEYEMAWVTDDAYSIPHIVKHDVIAWMPLPELRDVK